MNLHSIVAKFSEQEKHLWLYSSFQAAGKLMKYRKYGRFIETGRQGVCEGH